MGEVDPFEDHRQSASGDLQGGDAFLFHREPKGARFQTLEPYCKSIAIPIQYLHERVVAIQKDEQVPGQRIGLQLIADDADQPVEGLSHVDGGRAERNVDVWWNVQHEAMAVRSSAMYWGVVSFKRMVTPFVVMISTEGFTGSVIVTGTKVAVSFGREGGDCC